MAHATDPALLKLMQSEFAQIAGRIKAAAAEAAELRRQIAAAEGEAAARQYLDARKADSKQAVADEVKEIRGRDQAAAEKKASGVQGGEAAYGGAAAALSGVASGAMAAAKSLMSLPQTIAQLAGPFAQLVQQFDPSAVMVFNRAIEDLSAAFGSVLTPVMSGFTKLADAVNVVVTALAPQILPVVTEVAGALSVLAGQVLGALVPVLKVGIGLYTELAKAVMPIIESLGPLLGALSSVLGPLVTAIFTPMRAVLALAVPIIVKLVEIWTMIIGVIGEALNSFREIPGVTEFIKGAFDVFKTVLGWLTDRFKDLVAAVGAVAATVRHVVQNIQDIANPGRLAEVFGENFNRIRNANIAAPNAQQGAITNAARQAQYIDTAEIGRQARLASLSVRDQRQALDDNTAEMRRLREQLQQQGFRQEGEPGTWVRRTPQGVETVREFQFRGPGGSN